MDEWVERLPANSSNMAQSADGDGRLERVTVTWHGSSCECECVCVHLERVCVL